MGVLGGLQRGRVLSLNTDCLVAVRALGQVDGFLSRAQLLVEAARFGKRRFEFAFPSQLRDHGSFLA